MPLRGDRGVTIVSSSPSPSSSISPKSLFNDNITSSSHKTQTTSRTASGQDVLSRGVPPILRAQPHHERATTMRTIPFSPQTFKLSQSMEFFSSKHGRFPSIRRSSGWIAHHQSHQHSSKSGSTNIGVNVVGRLLLIHRPISGCRWSVPPRVSPQGWIVKRMSKKIKVRKVYTHRKTTEFFIDIQTTCESTEKGTKTSMLQVGKDRFVKFLLTSTCALRE